MNPLVEFAVHAAVAAGENAARIRQGGVVAETKPDASPVTIADRSNELLIREMIEREYPEDGLFGEEGARKTGASGRTWVIDPIDGTRDFVRGNRFWCVLVALVDASLDPIAGVAHFPMLGETYAAARGEGAFRNGERLSASNIASLDKAVFSPNGMHQMAPEPYAPALLNYLSKTWSVRSFGGALDACMLAAGQVDIWLERKAEPWDLAPLRLIIEEAGGRYFALNGTRRIDAGNAVACTPALEAEVRAFFGIPTSAGLL
ncbi:MAG: histidinol-phosphatase [Acidobacteria bacterium]|nr:histidinol-phosphatase [Acidobacteriota bacterium]